MKEIKTLSEKIWPSGMTKFGNIQVGNLNYCDVKETVNRTLSDIHKTMSKEIYKFYKDIFKLNFGEMVE